MVVYGACALEALVPAEDNSARGAVEEEREAAREGVLRGLVEEVEECARVDMRERAAQLREVRDCRRVDIGRGGGVRGR